MAERFDLTRRRALQLGAGAAFSAPTIVSLASTPAYAVAGSGGPIVIDHFSFDQAEGATQPSDGSFLFDNRSTSTSAVGSYSSITGGTLTISKSADAFVPGLSYTSASGPDLSACTELVLENVTQFGDSPQILINGGGGVAGPIGGTVVGSSIVFDISGVDAATLLAPTYLYLAPDGPTAVASAIVAAGPLVAA